MIKMIVKGNKKTALLHAKKNGLEVNFLNKTKTDIVLECEETEENTLKVMHWFTDNSYGINAPFIPGTLLHYSWS